MSDPGLRAPEHGHYSEQQGTLSPLARNHGSSHSCPLQTAQPLTSSSAGRALSPGPLTSCSLCSRAASSPAGLRWARMGFCSYSTHRLPSASLVTGEPTGTHVGSQGHQCSPGTRVISPSMSPTCWRRPALHPVGPTQLCHRHTHPCVAASGWGHARPDSWPSWWGGGPVTRTLRQRLLLRPDLGQQPGGLAQASRQSQRVRGHTRPLPGVGMRAHPAGAGDSRSSGPHGRTGPHLG